MNYSGKKIEKLTVKISNIKKVDSVRSVEQGKLASGLKGGFLVVNLPLGTTDMLLIDH
jgi:hypothetical protein